MPDFHILGLNHCVRIAFSFCAEFEFVYGGFGK